MRRIPIRMKLAAALAVPLIGLFFITAVEVAETAADVDDVRAQTALARASVGPVGGHHRHPERAHLGGRRADRPGERHPAARRRLRGVRGRHRRSAIASFRDTLQSGSDTAAQAYAASLENLDDLGELPRRDRRQHQARATSPTSPSANDVYQDYLALIRPFLDANSRVALAIDDAQLRQATSLVDTTTRQLEILSELARTSILEISRRRRARLVRAEIAADRPPAVDVRHRATGGWSRRRPRSTPSSGPNTPPASSTASPASSTRRSPASRPTWPPSSAR